MEQPMQAPQLTQEIQLETEQGLSHRRLLEQCPSPGIQQALIRVKKFAQRTTPVLLTGESGTGKELFAHTIHDLSPRNKRPFVVANCANQSGQLIADEFFGHVKGAYTGAISDRQGLFERADGGTLFLDEVGELPLDLQPKILRVLQERETLRLGGTYLKPTDFRLVIATNRNLAQMVKDGQFREDLFYRLNVLQIDVPPLRERKEDILPLAQYFVTTCRGETDPTELAEDCQSLLLRHPWRGNVRELKNIIEQALALAEGDSVRPEDLQFQAYTNPQTQFSEHVAQSPHLSQRPDEEMARITAYLCDHVIQQGNFVACIDDLKARIFLEAYSRLESWNEVSKRLGCHVRTVRKCVNGYQEKYGLPEGE
ncbi:MAG: hypothetical protein COV91_02940 [Candidatus Taylorbacteria bacterium CG11_big_fil_rev_8_21_14_0_20_46_11]|uniref:Sigma-54 factor interaction domain-containing protein n=1 Tax=Candidatus Taylorbacteria bacterium CG11_big_fil_rev_8_21_14_0_20_46_11 TaxID=1975025 RepID=A0A2H0KBM2_9BACT|nr:MAG: hypothetical protein COV91_02940 [Candidatus Taylorbacteria bacterium CG11_big_fil_rev_8_21_14_0_20_46_11]